MNQNKFRYHTILYINKCNCSTFTSILPWSSTPTSTKKGYSGDNVHCYRVEQFDGKSGGAEAPYFFSWCTNYISYNGGPKFKTEGAIITPSPHHQLVIS